MLLLKKLHSTATETKNIKITESTNYCKKKTPQNRKKPTINPHSLKRPILHNSRKLRKRANPRIRRKSEPQTNPRKQRKPERIQHPKNNSRRSDHSLLTTRAVVKRRTVRSESVQSSIEVPLYIKRPEEEASEEES